MSFITRVLIVLLSCGMLCSQAQQPSPSLISNLVQRVLSTGEVYPEDLVYYRFVDDKLVITRMLKEVEEPIDGFQVSVKVFLSNKVKAKVPPEDLLLGMILSDNQKSFREYRSLFHKSVQALAVKEARQLGQPTVGVVVPKYKAVVDASNSGLGLVEALLDLGITFPLDWDVEKAKVEDIILAIYAGEQAAPTETDLVIIELYKGIAGLNEFVRIYNGL